MPSRGRVRAYVLGRTQVSELDGQEMDKQGEIIAAQLGEKKIAEGYKKCFPHHVAIKSSQEEVAA